MADSSSTSERQRRARSIFQAALALPEIQRATYVANVCRGELELRREVERMLELDRARTGGLRRPADMSAPPERVNNYDVVSKIGEGGMGAVFLARHHFFERSAALKVLHPHLCSDETLVQRFLNEARAANAIRHINIIEVIDAGLMVESGAPYLLMEYLQGDNLAARLKVVGQMALPEALQILGQTASALAAAHDQGIVHRDLKPENLFLVPRPDGGDLLKVLDFGIAKLRPEIGGKFVKTQPGAVVGTPAYMSPEQCMGNGAVDHRTDIYSLGVILYEVLGGKPPFEAEGMGGLLAAHILNEPAPLRTLRPDLPEAVEAAVMRALKKKPDERFQTMREMRAAFGEGAIPRPLPQSAQMAAQTLTGMTPSMSAPPKFPTPAENRATITSANALPMTVARDPARSSDHSTVNSTLNASATELAAQRERPRRRLFAVAAGAALALVAAVVVFGRGPSEAPVSAGAKPVAAPPVVPAVTQKLAPPITPPAKLPEAKPPEVVPAEKPAVAEAPVATVAAKFPKPQGAATPATAKAPKPGAVKLQKTAPAAGLPKPKEFEPPLW